MTVTPPPHWSDLIIRHLGPIALIIAIIGMVIGFCLPAVGAEPILADYRTPRIVEVPAWILKNIARVETHSHWSADPSQTVYVDRRDGAAGEVGMFQMKPIAFRQIGMSALRDEARRDPVCAEFCAVLYLRWCHRVAGTWLGAIALYHTGPDGDPDEGRDYVLRVQGRKATN